MLELMTTKVHLNLLKQKANDKILLFLDLNWIRTDVSYIFNDTLRDRPVHASFLLFYPGKSRISNLYSYRAAIVRRVTTKLLFKIKILNVYILVNWLHPSWGDLTKCHQICHKKCEIYNLHLHPRSHPCLLLLYSGLYVPARYNHLIS